MSMKPTNLQEWKAYIDTLTVDDLWSKAIAANTVTFARTLLDEGIPMEDHREIMTYFVVRTKELGGKVPAGGAWDLQQISKRLSSPTAL